MDRSRKLGIWVLAIACIPLAGCADVLARLLPDQRVQTPPARAPAPDPDHRVTWGETGCSVAGHYGIDVDALRSANGLWEAPELRLQPALGLTLPRDRPLRHEVMPGDTVYRLVGHYGVTMDALLAANDLEDPDRLAVAQLIRIPAGARTGCPPAPREPRARGFTAGAAATPGSSWTPAGGWPEVDALLEQARDHYRTADFSRAIELASAVRARLGEAPRAKAVDARRARAEWIAASSWVGLERSEEALPHFAAALELDPTLPDATSASPKIRGVVEQVRPPE